MYEKCFKQYVTETNLLLKILRKIKNNARNILRKEFCIQQNLFQLFQRLGHIVFIDDVCMKFVDKSLLLTDNVIPKYEND